MSENINLRPISELPEVESVSEGDKLLLNSDGEAKLIDPSKVGGSGGGGGTVYVNVAYVNGDFSEALFLCYADEALTQALDFETGKKLFMDGASVYGNFDISGTTYNISLNFSMITWVEADMKIGQGTFVNALNGGTTTGTLRFSDSQLD